MSAKPVWPRELARRDIEAAIEFYRAEAGPQVALRFVAALERALQALARHPASGSPSYGQALEIPGLRSRRIGRFPYLIFYLEREDHLDVWRLLHAHRDIPAWLQAP